MVKIYLKIDPEAKTALFEVREALISLAPKINSLEEALIKLATLFDDIELVEEGVKTHTKDIGVTPIENTV